MTVGTAIRRIIDRVNLINNSESVDVYAQMYRYKVLRDLPDSDFDAAYDEIVETLGFKERR